MAAGSKAAKPLTFKQFLYILDEYKDKGDTRMEVLCHLMYRCVRISDCLNTLTISDLYKKDGSLKKTISFYEMKPHRTMKDGRKRIRADKKRFIEIVGVRFTNALNRYWREIEDRDYNGTLFYSSRKNKPLQDSGVRRLLSEFIGHRKIEQCSPHSFRKGGARKMFEEGTSIELISKLLQHSSVKVTFVYIGISPEDEAEGLKPLEI